jgi:2-isopropylmalate synthase
MTYLLEQEYGLVLPRRLQIEFSRAVQRITDETGGEVAANDIHKIFNSEYLTAVTPYQYRNHHIDDSKSGEIQISVELEKDGKPLSVHGTGNGPIDAFINALGLDIKLMDFHEHAIGAGAGANAASYIELRVNNGPTRFGVGIDSNIMTASFRAVLSAVNRDSKLNEKTA